MPEQPSQPTATDPAVQTQAQPAAPVDDPVDIDEELAEPTEEPLEWQASEYVHHHKGAAWYGGLAIALVILLIVAAIFKLWLSIGVFLAMGAAIAVYAHKPPRVLTYRIDSNGITIDGRTYPHANFRSFAVLSDIEWHTIDLEPTQRFMPRLTVLFGDDDLDAIIEHLSQRLPRVDREPDLVERLSRYLRF